MGILYILLGTAFGAIITYLRLQNTHFPNNEALQKLQQKDDSLDERIKSGEQKYQRLEEALRSTKQVFDQREHELHQLVADLSTIKTQLETSAHSNPANEAIPQTAVPVVIQNDEVDHLKQQIQAISRQKSELANQKAGLEEENQQLAKRMEQLEKDLNEKITKCDELNHSLSKEKAAHEASEKKLQDQRTSIQALGKKFNSDFEKMGIKILEELESQQRSK